MIKAFFKQDVIAENGPFWIGFFAYIFIGCGFEEYYGKETLHLYINQYHTPFWDVFFQYLTNYSIPILGFIVLYICIRYMNFKTLLYILFSFLTNSLLVIFVKRVYFTDVHRPSHYFEIRGIDIHLIEGVTGSITYTYPSGHSSNAFLLLLFLSMWVRSKWWKFIFFILAALIAFSRVYVSKHFVIDTVGGVTLGVFCNIFTFYLFRDQNSSWLTRKIMK